MGSPPVQTPVLFLKGGGAAIFSADCVAALLKAGYDPEWFGSYDHVRGKITKAQARVAKHDEWEKGGKKGPEPELQPNDRYLANCQSGHISQDATHRKAGGRDDACANFQYGYDTSTAPCMPQTKGPWDPPGSEHNVASRHEVACALRDGPNKPYDPAQREKDEKERLDLVVNKRRPPEREPIAAKPSSSAGAAIGAGPSAATSTGAAAPKGSESSIPDEQKIQGEDAADCINNFKKAAMEAMRSQVTDQRMSDQADNRTTANGRKQEPGESDEDYRKAGVAHREKLKKEAEAAEAQLGEVKDQRLRLAQQSGGQATAAQGARAKADASPDDEAAQEKARAKGERIQDTRGAVGAAESAEAFMQADATAARRASDKAQTAHCEAEEGAKFAAMSPAERAAACQNPGMNRGTQTARSSGVSDQTKDQFDKTQAADKAGVIDS